MPDVTFFSSRFNDVPAPDAINEMLGADLAAWLRTGLMAAGFQPDFDVIAEDYGYGFWLCVDETRYWITSTEYEPVGFQGSDESKWLVGVHEHAGCLYVLWMRRRPKPDTVNRITQAIHTLLRNDPSISGITWWEQGVGRGISSPEPPGHKDSL